MPNINIQASNQQTPPPPPNGKPPGKFPPGLEDAISSLSDDQQSLTEQMLKQLSPEQRDQLKTALDEFKPQADQLTVQQRGEQFFSLLSDIYQGSTNSQDDGVDVYV